MCLIIDANQLVDFLRNTHPEKHGKLRIAVFGAPRRAAIVLGGKLAREYLAITNARAILLEMERNGQIRRARDEDVDAEQQSIEKAGRLSSDDPHVLGLAKVSGSRLLVSDDKRLCEDFKNSSILNPAGNIYTSHHHDRLIDKHCRSCRMAVRAVAHPVLPKPSERRLVRKRESQK